MLRKLMAYFLYVVAFLAIVASLLQDNQIQAGICLGIAFVVLIIGMVVDPTFDAKRR